jgi:riboflavin synthase
MFTGLVEELGRVKALVKGAQSARLTIAAKEIISDIKLGDSIAVNGTCLTIVDYADTWFTADVMPETVRHTVLNDLKPGDPVNLERTMKVGDRFGGHIVSGHIDGVGVIVSKTNEDNAIIVKIGAEPGIMRYVIKKGSIAIDGISLTVADAREEWFTVSIIPHTAKVTTVGIKKPGDSVNLETDVIGKYVERMLGMNQAEKAAGASCLSIEFLAKNGFL